MQENNLNINRIYYLLDKLHNTFNSMDAHPYSSDVNINCECGCGGDSIKWDMAEAEWQEWNRIKDTLIQRLIEECRK